MVTLTYLSTYAPVVTVVTVVTVVPVVTVVKVVTVVTVVTTDISSFYFLFIFFSSSIVTKLKKSNCDKSQKLKL